MKIAGVLIKMGVPVLKYFKPDLLRRIKIMNHHKIDLLFDIGANTGQYGVLMRTLGYTRKIVSFEPLNNAYEELQKVTKNDGNWETYNYALGSENGISTINISGNSVSSSILNIKALHVATDPQSGYIGKQEIEVKQLNVIFDSIFQEGKNVMLKIDTQGFEKQVLEGATNIINKVSLIQLEMSLVALYDSETLYLDIIDYLDKKGFKLIAFENGFNNSETGELLQVDGIFSNEKLKPIL
jgi:FkbM family methyltransferase